jgi:hypothetical protein
LSKPDPIFDKPGTSKLPPELAGKSPEEVAEYYSRREQILQERIRTAPTYTPPPPKAEKKEPTKFDMFGDPEGSVRRVVSDEVTDQVNRVTQMATPAIVNACRITVRDQHPDYNRFSAEIERRMATMDASSQMNPEFWNYTYQIVKGEYADKLVEEAREQERQKLNPVERPTPPGAAPPPPRQLSEEEKKIASKFDMTNDEYRQAAERYEAMDGVLPLTTDNSRRSQARNQKKKEKVTS